ncbi:MAG: chloride channel protein, partial [Alphaproteobacteria bacterium]|nr:chloride channel protein [Alphaproteobacteria bacterium]
ADAIEASAMNGGRMSAGTGLRAAFVSALSIGAGASVGREGPAVHLGAALAGGLAKKLHLTRSLSRSLLGCGVAAAVAASFNAPIAGALFANEVVIGHYALRAFAPVVIASVTGTMASRAFYGDYPAFLIPPHEIGSYLGLPAFILIGLLAGGIAIALLKGIFAVQDAAEKLPVPAWARPALGGFLVGLIALFLPQVMGVGYGVTDDALSGQMALGLLLAVLAAKVAATALSLGLGFGGGIFSPSLVVGAMLGGAFGIVATGLFPELDTGPGGYTLIGMGAVAAATLGAPISTTLIMFELTGDYELTLGVMLAAVMSTGVTRNVLGLSFFTLQLERRGLDLKGGFETALLRQHRVADVMHECHAVVPPSANLAELRWRLQESPGGELFVVDEHGILIGTITFADLSEAAFDRNLDLLVNAADAARLHPPVLRGKDDLETALNRMTDTGEHTLAVVDDHDPRTFVGTVEERHVITAYNRALLKSRHEERDL